MISDPLGLAAYGSYGRRYADGGGVQGGSDAGYGGNGGIGNGTNEGMADGLAAAQEVGPGSYSSAGAPSYGLDGGTLSGAAAPAGWFDRNLGSIAGFGLGFAGVPGLGTVGKMGVDAAMSGKAPSGRDIANGIGGIVGGLAGGPLGAIVGGQIGTVGGYLADHADPNATQAAAAAAGAGVNRGDYSGPGSEWMHNPLMATPQAASQPMAQGLASGGVPQGRGHISRLAHGSGLVPGDTMGRADAVEAQVPQDSYVVPADVVSGIGQGNTQAGGKRLTSLLGAQFKAQGFAGGGAVRQMPVRLSCGEYVVHPAHCAHLGGGDVKAGHAELDRMVQSVRDGVAKHAKSAPPPK